MSTILVTGATGFIGRHLVCELVRRGHRVTALARAPAAFPPTVGVLVGDLRRTITGLPDALDEADAVVHLAGGSGATWRATFDVNVTATERLLKAISAAGWRNRLVHVSTFAVYGFNQVGGRSEISEATPVEPCPERRDDYAWTKTLQERLVRRVAPDAVVVRPGAVYGAERRFQPRLGRMMNGTLVVFGGGNRMPLSYVENTASLLADCVEHPDAPGRTFNAIDPDILRQWDYVHAWRQLDAEPPRVAPIPLTALRALGHGLSVADRLTGGRIAPPGIVDPYRFAPSFGSFDYAPSAAVAELGWEAPVGCEEALRRTFATPISVG